MAKDKKFRFYAPAELIKAKGKDGENIMRLGGIASTSKQDSDGEVLMPEGFDLSPLKNSGFINWSHMKTPEAVIGEPYKAELRKNGLYLEADLYADSEIAKNAYKLAQVLSKNSKNRKLGWSIEGTATERDPLNDKIVKKAKITGVALCLMPKNPGTFADIIKGEFEYLDSDELIKSEESNMELEVINKALKDELQKTYSTIGEKFVKSEIEDEEKNKKDETKKALATSSSSGKAIAREHVDGDLKERDMKKAHAMKFVLNKFSDIELTKAEKICEIILKVSEMNNKNVKVPTDDDISKAMQALGISQKEEVTNETLVKAQKNLDSVLESEKASQEEIQKAMDLVSNIKETLEKAKTAAKTAGYDEEEESEEDMEKIKTAAKTAAKTTEEDKEEEDLGDKMKSKDKMKEVFMKKAKIAGDKGEDKYEKYLVKADGTLEKSDDGKMYVKDGDKNSFKEANGGQTSTPDLQKSMEDGFNNVVAKQDEMAKAIGTVLLNNQKDAEEFQKGVLERLEVLENATPGRKSAMSKGHAERKFDDTPLDTLEKGMNGNGVENGISISRDRALVGQIIEKAMYSTLEKGGQIDPIFEKALTVYEVSKQVNAVTRQALKQKYNINLVD